MTGSLRGWGCSEGKRLGASGAKSGNAHLTWAFSEAAVLFLRDHPAAQKDLASLEKKHDKGKALTILAQKLARAVYYRDLPAHKLTFPYSDPIPLWFLHVIGFKKPYSYF